MNKETTPSITRQKLKAIPLPGLTFDTLGHYFAALGLLRLLSRKWPQVRGCWRNGMFVVIAGPESSEELEGFVFEIGLMDQWTPYGKPWDAPQKADTKAAQSNKPVRAVAQWRTKTVEAELPLLASHLVPGERRNSFNPIFGTGGNAGKRLFFSGWNNAKQAILKPARGIKPEGLKVDLHSFLQGNSCSILGDFSAGCWFSQANKVYNSGFKKPFAEGQITPWAMLLACESFPLLAGSTSRLIGAHRRQFAAFPFVSRAPAPESETACGQWLGDFWAPIWERPLSLPEVTAVFQSGKAELDGRAALSSAAFAGAIMQRGVDKGLSEFRCFTLQRTTSDNTFESQLTRVIAVPRENQLFSELIRRTILLRDRLPEDRKQGKSWRYKGLQGPLDRALLDLAQVVGEENPERQYEASLGVLDAAFNALAKVDRNKAHREAKVTFQRLSLDLLAWLAEHEGGTPEFRIALAIASLRSEVPSKVSKPADQSRYPQSFLAYRLGATERGRFWSIPKDRPLRAVWSPRNLIDNLCALARRRLIESPSSAIAPFRSYFRAPLPDVLAFLQGQVDDDLLAQWLDRLSLFNWLDGKENQAKLRESLKTEEQSFAHWSTEAALYAYFRPLIQDELLRGLQKQAVALLSGKDIDGKKLSGHEHSYFGLYLETETRKPTRLMAWRKKPFTQAEEEAIRQAASIPFSLGHREKSAKGQETTKRDPWKVHCVPLDNAVPLPSGFDPNQSFTQWESLTPYVPPRHAFDRRGKQKANESPQAQLVQELERLGIKPTSIEYLDLQNETLPAGERPDGE